MSSNPYKGRGKVPVSVLKLDVIRVPRTVDPVHADVNHRMVRFRFDIVDHGGDWCILDISRQDHSELLRFLSQIEAVKAGEMFKPGQKLFKVYSNMGDCPNPAVLTRLANEFEGLDHMVRLELDGMRRLYGVMTGNEFHIIWWDPKHEIWPSKKKHT